MATGDLNISMIMKLIDQVTAPAKKVQASLRNIAQDADRTGRAGMAWADQQLESVNTRRAAMQGEALALAATAAGFAAMLTPAIRFEQSMAGVGAVSKATEDELARLTATARELGATTPWAASEAADGMKYLSMAGFEVNETIAAMPGMLNLASAGAIDLANAADIASNILTGFGLQADQMDRLGDVMVNTFTSSNTDLVMLGETMKYVAPVAEALGVSLEETAAMAGKLGDAGIQGSQAGTSLRAMMSRLSAPTTEAAKALEVLNVQTADADGNLRNMPDILSDLDAAMGGLGTAARQDLTAAIFGLEAASAASVLLGAAGSGALQGYTETLHETGSAARVAAGMNDTTAGALKALQSRVEDLAISVGTILLPALVDLIDMIQPGITAMSEWAAAHPELISLAAKLAAGFVALSMASIALRWTTLTMITPILRLVKTASWMLTVLPQAKAALMALGGALKWVGRAAAANPIGATILALIVLVEVLYDNWNNIVSYFQEKIARIAAAFDDGLLNGVLKAISEFNPFRLIQDGMIGLIAYIMDEWLGLPDWIIAAFASISLWDTGVAILQSLWDGMASLLPAMVSAISSALSNLVPDWMRDAWGWVSGGDDGGGPAPPAADGGASYLPPSMRDSGGPVRAGQPYVVGERGEELFVPGTSGRVLPGWNLDQMRHASQRLDRRAPLPARAAAPQITRQGDTINITISPAPGMDTAAIARAVARELAARDDARRDDLHDGVMFG